MRVPRLWPRIGREHQHDRIKPVSGYVTSVPRTAIAILLVVAGIVWMAVYINLAKDAALFEPIPDVEEQGPGTPLPWMADLARWNYLIGFVLIWVGLIVGAHKTTPLGRGRGVVIGMLGSFLLGLVWIVLFYFIGQGGPIPVMKDLDQYNLMVGIGFMAVGFSFATKWE